eukprot:TRINITY_DN6047_c0_g1_i1.p1 TRINITY_DN6047_c0_g1~~TRINITY_DN6047_c0_g1_i1.p1  ORF type:complete len:204 (+),score=59.85 TRINITY_DN6047_c0_g1_i1:48-659(+)
MVDQPTNRSTFLFTILLLSLFVLIWAREDLSLDSQIKAKGLSLLAKDQLLTDEEAYKEDYPDLEEEEEDAEDEYQPDNEEEQKDDVDNIEDEQPNEDGKDDYSEDEYEEIYKDEENPNEGEEEEDRDQEDGEEEEVTKDRSEDNADIPLTLQRSWSWVESILYLFSLMLVAVIVCVFALILFPAFRGFLVSFTNDKRSRKRIL